MPPVEQKALPNAIPVRWRVVQIAAVALLLALHFALAVGSKRNESTTSDEIAHVTGGVAYWKFNDYRLQPENGVLPQRWVAVPAVLAGAKFPSLDQVYWQTSDVWVMGHEFFYETGEDHFPRLMAARAMTAVFSVGVGLIVFLWSGALFGPIAGFFSLGLFVFSPLFLAHSGLATSDVCMAFFFLASLGLWWRHLHDGHLRWGALSALVFGLACVAKFSAVLLLPMMGILAAARILASTPLQSGSRTFVTKASRLWPLVASAAVHGIVAWAIIWAFYGFRYSAFNPAVPAASQFIRRWDLIHANIGWQGRVVDALARLHALPEAFLYGYSYVIESAQSRAAFLNGHYSSTGWWTFFPWTFALKTTIPVLIACVVFAVAAIGRWCRRRSAFVPDLYRVMPLVVLFVVYWAFSLTTHLNIGQRHILPTYPVIFIAAGTIIFMARSWRSPLRWLALALVAWQAADACSIAPHYLAFFNAFAGGPREGYRHLVDSSLDWGQDLPGLKAWLDKNVQSTTPVYLSYFGTGEPAYYHIRAHRYMMLNGFKLPDPFVALQPGVYCISTTCLEQVYSPTRGPWSTERERAYQELRRLEPAFLDYEQRPESRAEWKKTIGPANWTRSRIQYEDLRFARLCTLLRARNPDAQIGYSINVYRVSANDISAAIDGSFDRWRQAVEQAIAQRAAE